MHSEEKAIRDGLKKVITDMQQNSKVSDLNKGFNEGVKRGKDWQMTMALICSFLAFVVVMVAVLLTAGRVEGRQQEMSANYQMQQKVIIDKIAMMEVEHRLAIDKLNKQVKK